MLLEELLHQSFCSNIVFKLNQHSYFQTRALIHRMYREIRQSCSCINDSLDNQDDHFLGLDYRAELFNQQNRNSSLRVIIETGFSGHDIQVLK